MSRAVVAVFDLDGTLTRRDTLAPFLRAAIGTRRVARAMLRSSPSLVRAVRDRSARDAAKERVLIAAIGRRAELELRDVAERFAPTVVLRAEIVAHLRWHQSAGHETVVLSASPTLYVDAIARRLGIDVVVATELEVIDGVVTGRYSGRNCRAEEKLARLLAWLGERDVELHAYGNAPDDEPVLAHADHATYV